MLPANSRVVLCFTSRRWPIYVATVVSPALRLRTGGGGGDPINENPNHLRLKVAHGTVTEI